MTIDPKARSEEGREKGKGEKTGAGGKWEFGGSNFLIFWFFFFTGLNGGREGREEEW